MASAEPVRKLLVIDTNYTLEGIRERQIQQSITCRDLEGFFEHVWSVHPFATLVTSDRWGPRYGSPDTYELSDRHTIIEGRVGRFPWLKWLFPLNFLISQLDLLVRLRSLIKRERISVIRVSSPLYVGLFGLLLARATGVPLVVRVGANHDKYFQTTGRPLEPRLMRSRKIEKLVERFVFTQADLVAAANQDNLEFALANGAKPERSTLFRYGNLVDRRHYSEPAKREMDSVVFRDLGIKPGEFLLYVGRLEPIKQVDHVIDVLAEVREQGFNVKAVLAGDGTMQTALERQAVRLGVRDQVVFAGNVGQDRLAQLFPAAAAVVSPHTGRALAEAALGEARIVAYDVDWQAELIESGVTGILVRHGDYHAMADGVVALLTNSGEAKALGRAVRKRASEMLDPESLDDHERSEYRKLLSREL